MDAPQRPYSIVSDGPKTRVITIAAPPSRVGVPLLTEVPWLHGSRQEFNDYWLEAGADIAKDDPVVSVRVAPSDRWQYWHRRGGMGAATWIRIHVSKGGQTATYGVRLDKDAPLQLPQSIVDALRLVPELVVS